MEKQMSLSEYIEQGFIESEKKTMTNAEIYDYVDNSDYQSSGKTLHNSIRTQLQRCSKFMSVTTGVWAIVGERSKSLIIEGDGRSLEGVQDSSIDCIITDHPYSMKSSHSSGNQKNFADYECFRYTREDFENKARVLKDGAYLCEFLPWENAENSEYLSEIRRYAKDCGFEFYCMLDWRKFNSSIADAKPDANTGRTTKGSEMIIVWSKGKPRNLINQNKGRCTRKIIRQHIEDYYIKRGDKKSHQAEKPIELYEYLIQTFTEEGEICLDQFGGSCNLAKACINTGRMGIVFEKCREFINNAVGRFGAITVIDKTALEPSAA